MPALATPAKIPQSPLELAHVAKRAKPLAGCLECGLANHPVGDPRLGAQLDVEADPSVRNRSASHPGTGMRNAEIGPGGARRAVHLAQRPTRCRGARGLSGQARLLTLRKDDLAGSDGAAQELRERTQRKCDARKTRPRLCGAALRSESPRVRKPRRERACCSFRPLTAKRSVI